MIARSVMILAAFALGGCSMMASMKVTDRQATKNADGHVVGFKQMLRNQETGEVSAQAQLFEPVRNAQGEVIAYEERSGGNAIIRSVDGRQIGTRFNDLRSRSTNTKSRGITLVIGELDTRPLAMRGPDKRRVVDNASVHEPLVQPLVLALSYELSAIN